MSLGNDRDGGAPVRAARLPSAMESAYRELFEGRLVLISLCITCFWVLFLTVAGPGSELLSDPVLRAVYFGSISALSWPLGHCMAIALLYYLRRCRAGSVALASLAAGLYMAANIATVAYALYGLMMPDGLPPPGWPLFYLRAAVAAVVHFGVIQYLAVQRARLRPLIASPVDDRRTDAGGSAAPLAGPADASRSSEAAPHLPERFLDRLPEEVGHDVVYLKVNGHYINVNTTSGSASVLMRFADAVAELGDAGMQVHRSFWVASRHLIDVSRRDDRTVVRVTGGKEVPVSRTFLAAVRKLAADRGSGIPQRPERPAEMVRGTDVPG